MLGRKKSRTRKSGERHFSPTRTDLSHHGGPVKDADYEYYVETARPVYPHLAGESVTDLIAMMQDEGWDYVSQTPLGADVNVTFRRLHSTPNQSGPIIVPRRTSTPEIGRGCSPLIIMIPMNAATMFAQFFAFLRRRYR